MRIVMADAGLPFNGLTPETRPQGGAESAFVALAEALAAGGAEVTALTASPEAPLTHKGVRWGPVRPTPAQPQVAVDLLIANRDPALLTLTPARRRLFWLHNPAQFLRKPRYLWPLLRLRPTVVFAGPSHAATAPGWVPIRKALIPLGVESVFLATPRPPAPPPPRALFVSNPNRGLAPLAALWGRAIAPQLPGAGLHVFGGPGVYGATGPWAARMAAALAAAAAEPGVVLREPLPKAALAQEYAAARVMLYFGDPGETFCLALAEAQAMGVPCVVKPVGAVAERVIDGVTGYVRADDAGFAEAALRLLTDDALWAGMSAAALARRPAMGWAQAAAAFTALA